MGSSRLWWRQVPIHLLFVVMLTACGAPGTPSQSVSGPDCRPEQVQDSSPPSQAPAAILTAPTFRHEALTGIGVTVPSKPTDPWRHMLGAWRIPRHATKDPDAEWLRCLARPDLRCQAMPAGAPITSGRAREVAVQLD